MFLSGSLQTRTVPQTGASCYSTPGIGKPGLCGTPIFQCRSYLWSQEAFDLQAGNIFEMPAIISEEGEVVLTGRDADHEIEIRNALPLGA